MKRDLATWVLAILLSFGSMAHAETRHMADVPLVQQALAGPADVPDIELERRSLLLQELGFRQEAEDLRHFSERRNLLVLLGEPYVVPATVGDAITQEGREAQPLGTLQGRLLHDGVSFSVADASSPLAAPVMRPDPLNSGQLSFVALAPNVWGLVKGNAQSPGESDLMRALQLFVALKVNSQLSAEVDVSARFQMASDVSLACDPQKLAAHATSTVYCHTDMLQPRTRDAVASAIQALASGERALQLHSMSLTSPESQTWTYTGTLPMHWQPPGTALTLESVQRDLAGASCRDLNNCWGRLSQATSKLGSPGFLLSLLIVFGTAGLRWMRADGTQPPVALRNVFFGYLALCLCALALALLESFSQAPLKGVLSQTFSLLLALPWSSALVETRQLPRQYGHGGMSDAAVAWLFILVNLAWLGFLAFYRGAARRRPVAQRAIRK